MHDEQLVLGATHVAFRPIAIAVAARVIWSPGRSCLGYVGRSGLC